MLYQKILTDEAPYQLVLGCLNEFTEHRHADIEFHYCVEGSFDIIIDKQRYHLTKGDMALIGSGISHAVPTPDSSRLVLTGILGVSFLKKQFNNFLSSSFCAKVINLLDENKNHTDLLNALNESVLLYPMRTHDREHLLLTSNLFKICAFLLDELTNKTTKEENVDLRAIANIEKALELIYYNYKDDISVDDAANISGYGKSNFCKIFKHTTGTSFHQALNKHRINVACGLLTQTALSVTDIAQEVGFGETKTFCRVFRELKNLTPTEYRSNNK